MAALPIHRFPDPLLKQPSRPVKQVDAQIAKLIERMVETMRANRGCVGLAAPQVGFSLRIAVMDVTNHPKAAKSHGLLVFVNPEILWAGEFSMRREGCLSVPDFTADVKRARRIRVRAFDQFGSSRQLLLEGFEAVVAQHEVDHLDGYLFLDRVANVKRDIFRRKIYL